MKIVPILSRQVTRVLFVLASLLASVCSEATSPSDREKELSYLRCIMPETLLEFAHVDMSAIENIAIVGEGTDQYLGLHVFPGQKKLHGGIPAEVSVDYPHHQGDTVRYAWRFMVPKGFQSDAPKNRWWLIGQWHDQPDKNRGEKWEAFASKSLPVLLSIGELQGKLAIAIAYGLDQSQKRGPLFLESGKWHSVALEIYWSRKVDGKATVFFDDMEKPAAVLEGPNMHNDNQHYLKLGMYRHPEITSDNWIYVDDLTITKQAMRRTIVTASSRRKIRSVILQPTTTTP